MINNLVFEILKLRIKQEPPRENLLDFSFIEEIDDNLIWVNLDCSGFDLDLIENSLEELEAVNRSWREVKDGELLFGVISQSSIMIDSQKTIFKMLKSEFNKLVNNEQEPT